MRTDTYQAWLDSLTESEYNNFVEDYGIDNLLQAYNDTIRQLINELLGGLT
jgi:hypothetical protein